MDGQTRESLFESLYSRFGGEVLKYALREGVNRTDAEDVVVETFLVCWRRLDELPSLGLPWLLGVARRVIANQRRANKRRRSLRRKIMGSMRHTTATASDEPADSLDLGTAFAALTEGDREVITLVVWQGLNHQEAAEVLACSQNTFTKRYERARRRLLSQLPPGRTLYEYSEDDLPTPTRVDQ